MFKKSIGIKKGSAVLALLLGSSMMFAGCGSSSAGEQNDVSAVMVDMQKAEAGNLTLQNSFVGTISPQESVYVIPFASGTVTAVNYKVGDYVNAGDVLFKIDDEGAQLQLRQAQLSLSNAKQQADLSVAGNQISTMNSYEQAQIGYVKTKDAYDELDDAIDDLDDKIDEIEDAITAASQAGSVSGNDAVVAKLQEQLTTAKAARDELKAKMDSADLGLKQAESGYRAAEASKGLMDDTANSAQIGINLAGVGVDSAKLALSYYTVTAPISGVVTGRNVEVNGMATSSSPAFVISNESSMTVTFNVGESVKNTLSVGDKIVVERNGVEYTGNITEVAVAVNQQTGLFAVKASVDADGSALPGGVSVKITADTYKADNSIIIPYDAVYYDNNGAYVYLCVDGKAAKTYVTTGIFNDTEIAILDGISLNDTIITSWSARLLDGVEVVAPDTVNK